MGESAGLAKTGFAFRPCHRLHRPQEFTAVFRQRRFLRGVSFDLLYRPNATASARLGLVIAKKLARRAVVRNVIRRVSREVFRLSRQNLPALDVVLRLTRPVTLAGAAQRHEWRAEIQKLMAGLKPVS